jgi:carbamoyltransferase
VLICGLKLTHDGTVALIEDGRLVCGVEMEKLDNRPRYSTIEDLDVVAWVVEEHGYDLADVDHFVVDGWGGVTCRPIELTSGGRDVAVTVAPYHENAAREVFAPGYRGTMEIAGRHRSYSSYFHASGHIASAYYTSPFAARGESSFVLVWDGGMFPRLYFLDPARNTVENGGALFPVMGHFYATAGNHFGPFPRTADPAVVAGHSVAGKLMAYIAMGTERPEVREVLESLWEDNFTGPSRRAVRNRRTVGGWGLRGDVPYLAEFFLDLRAELGSRYSDEDVLASLHAFVERTLVAALGERISAWKGALESNLCFAGGCALNIKWNSALRDSGLFREVWVPPFPNDAGSALGAAICHAVRSDSTFGALDWHVRLGPTITDERPELPGWTREPCDVTRLAEVLHAEQEPVVVLDGRAELGPRALGGRSILAPATDPAMKDRLNQAKLREAYRPVAPVCLESAAPRYFAPGTPDPYMLFDHRVRDECRGRIPAVAHLDGTARLQTVNESDDPFLAALLTEYAKLSGIPVLCNTSANHPGRGFFPDVRSAAEWGRLSRIWHSGHLYRKA